MNLDDLLKDALKAKAERDALVSGKAKLRDSRLDPKARNEVADMVRALESAHEYTAVAVVFRQTRYVCECGSSILAGGQFLQQEKHIRIAGTQRFIAVKTWAGELPLKRDTTEVKVVVCNDCAVAHGFPAEAA